MLTLVAQEIDKIEERRVKSNLTASTAILAGLLLDEENISRIFRSEMMKESVIYQEILAEGERKGEKIGERKSERKIALNLLQLGMTVEKVAQVTELSVEEVQSLQLKHDVSNSE
jgi:predicted transposase/invertase (TIGR01784 family)